jgi:RimJ/RimL family protein N-acetyltransferase
MSTPSTFTPISIPPSSKFGHRLSLRSPTLSDAPSLLARAQNPSCVSHIPGLRYGKPTLTNYESLISAWQTQSTQLKSRFLIIVLISTGESIGDTGFESLHRTIHGYGDKVASGEGEVQIGEAGIMLDDSPAVRGKGYAVEALNMVFEYGFDLLGLDEIRVRTMEANAAMRGIMEQKFGFNQITNLVKSEIAADSPGTGGDFESVGEAPLGKMERYWKLMSDRVGEGVREVAVCYCIERVQWRSWTSKTPV